MRTHVLALGFCACILVAQSARADDSPVAAVHLRSGGAVGVVLESHDPGSARWNACCSAPCDVTLPVDRDYRVTAAGVRPSACIRLAVPTGGRLVLELRPVSSRVHTAGLVLIGVGIVTFIAGDVMSDVYLAAAAGHDVLGGTSSKLASDLIVPGLVIAAVGVAALATGGAMFLATREPSRVDQSAPVAGETYEMAERASWPLPRMTSTRILSASF
jgi:hypothetical protein